MLSNIFCVNDFIHRQPAKVYVVYCISISTIGRVLIGKEASFMNLNDILSFKIFNVCRMLRNNKL